jgi:hypothetical protein
MKKMMGNKMMPAAFKALSTPSKKKKGKKGC